MRADTSKLQLFYYHKVGRGNAQAKDWLSGNNPLERPATVAFFGPITVDDIRNLRHKGLKPEQFSQIQEFVSTANDPAKRDQTCILVVDAKVWFLKAAGEIEERKRDTRKMMPVEVILTRELNEVPPILAGIGSNQYLVRGTYRRISEEKNRGNLKAIYSVLEKPWEQRWYDDDPSGLLECLSSVQLETLVAKILETHACFVPAYRGGSQKYVDLFAFSDRLIDIDGLEIDSSGVQIQVKGGARLRKGTLPDDVHLIGYACENVGRPYFDEGWLFAQINALPEVQEWLRRSLYWVPEDFMRMYL